MNGAITTVTTATNSASTHPVANVNQEGVAREWRATGSGANEIIFNLGASLALGCIELHGINFASAPILTSPNGSTTTARGTLTRYANKQGRGRGIVSLDGVTAQYVHVQIPSATPVDGAAFHRIGSATIMKTRLLMPIAPAKGYGVVTRVPQIRTVLANGRVAAAAIGQDIDEVRFSFRRKYDQSLDTFIQQLRIGAVIDMALPQFPHHIWPLRFNGDALESSHPKANSEESSIVLMEIA